MSGSNPTDYSNDSTKLSVEAVAELLSKGRALIQTGEFSGAQSCMERLLSDYPNHSEALYFTAVAQRFSENYQSALSSLQKLIEIEPTYGRAWQERGHILMAQGEIADARASFQQAVIHNGSLIASWQMLMTLTDLPVDQKAYDFFEDKFQRLAALPPELLGVRNMMEEGKLSKAEQLCRSFLQQHPKHIEGALYGAGAGPAGCRSRE